MTLYAGLAILLSRLSGQQDIVIGTPVANRQRTEMEGLIGFFVNTLALRVELVGEHERRGAAGAGEGADAGGRMPIRTCRLSRWSRRCSRCAALSHSPVFQVMLVLQNTPEGSWSCPGLQLVPQRLAHRARRSLI